MGTGVDHEDACIGVLSGSRCRAKPALGHRQMLKLVLMRHRALAKEYGGQLNREQIVEVLRDAGVGEGGELAELLWTEMGLSEDAHITQVCSPAYHTPPREPSEHPASPC